LLSDFDDRTIHRAAQLSAPVCTEQPGTPWFDLGVITVRSSPLVLDINAHGVAALCDAGIEAHHLRLGAVPSMRAATVERDVDVLFLGGKTDHRAERLAQLAPTLWERDVELRLFSFTRPVRRGEPGLVFGDDKYRLLARSRILLNIHRDDARPGYFEWARMVEAMANGCCIVTEPVTGHEPFLDGEHFVATDDPEAALAELLADPERCRRIGESARVAALDSFPLRSSLVPVLERLDRLDPAPVITRRVPRYRRRLIVAQQHPLLPAFRPNRQLRADLYQALVAETALQRRIERARSLAVHGVDEHVEIVRSDAYDGASPRVSVVVTLYDYAHLVTDTLESVVVSTGTDLEIIVIDDHSTDDGRDVVKRFIERHPDTPIVLLGSDVNRGLPAARNLGFEHARAELVMVMDADNLVYPNAIARLSAALDDDPGAAFAYSSLEEFGASAGVRSAMAWNVERLCESNYIDAQAMIRLDAWRRHGGYRVGDELVFGWEDWELWLRLAAAGERGVHLAEMLGRYRTQPESMIATTNLVADQMAAHLRELHPALPWPGERP
ncbi:glycosyltransferase, partial [Ilumatobacter sp.]|uniref:glycosyltransferase n=1 Tax=Ilumatobacter sp. TaxID=1967498 RepID=UPI003AF88597